MRDALIAILPSHIGRQRIADLRLFEPVTIHRQSRWLSTADPSKGPDRRRIKAISSPRQGRVASVLQSQTAWPGAPATPFPKTPFAIGVPGSSDHGWFRPFTIPVNWIHAGRSCPAPFGRDACKPASPRYAVPLRSRVRGSPSLACPLAALRLALPICPAQICQEQIWTCGARSVGRTPGMG